MDRLVGVWIVCVASVASAQPGQAEPSAPPSVKAGADQHTSLAFAVNNPIMWSDSTALGGSLYAGVDAHQVLRANIARYKHHSSTIGDIVSIASGDDGDEALHTGDTTDVGVGYMYFPRRAYDGPSFELGALVRMQDFADADEFASDYRVATDTRVYAARALIGWSWEYHGAFFALSAGMSAGYERGTQTVQHSDLDMMTTATRVSRFVAGAEAFARLGYAFDF